MASPCDNRLTVNIKNLPIVTDINRGDFLIVETPDGTGILDFRNFLITLDNTTFSSTFLGFNTKINELSANITSNTQEITASAFALSASVDTLYTLLSTSVVELSSKVITDNTFITLSSDGVEASILDSSNINNTKINSDGSIDINFTTNFANPFYCVSTGGYYYDEELQVSTPINLAVTRTTTNTITVVPLTGTAAFSPLTSVTVTRSPGITRGWVRIIAN